MAFPTVPTLPFVANTDAVPSTVLNAWRTFFPSCLDADGGGTYTNTAPIIWDSGAAEHQYKNTIRINSGGFLRIDSGGSLQSAAGSDVDFLEPIRVAGLNNNGGAILVTDPIRMTGTPPAATADPSANALHSSNLPKVWGRIVSNGSGGAVISDGHNVASVAVSSTEIQVTFARAFASTSYAVQVTVGFSAPLRKSAIYNNFSMTSSFVALVVFDDAGIVINPSTTIVDISIVCMGRQS